jgi:cell fate regulator YaaT (PSP1 superfamily)
MLFFYFRNKGPMDQEKNENTTDFPEERTAKERAASHYRVQFRPEEQIFSASTRLHGLKKDDVVMVQAEHGLEPARLMSVVPGWPEADPAGEKIPLTIVRRSTRDEVTKFEKLGEMEHNAFRICSELIGKLNLPMNLVKVERFFNGGKIIFYFTAENRVDFRELVKNLVQEFRTRVEMRQIGVRHETKMVGGLGCCGRELCCSSFIQKFESVSIKMAKEQNLPLNPAKISGACNRLLCCLNYEYKAYKTARKAMPKIGKKITFNDKTYKVRQHNVLNESIVVSNEEGGEVTLIKDEWQSVVSQAATKDK